MPQSEAQQERVSPELREKCDAVVGKPEFGVGADASATQTPSNSNAGAASGEPPTGADTQDDDAFLKADPSDAPEIQKLKADLQKGFHRKMQKLSEDARQKAAEVAQTEQKAQAFEALMRHPDPGSLLAQLRGVNPTQVEEMPQIPRTKMQIPASLAERFEPDTLNAIQELLDLHYQQATTQILEPKLQPYQRMVEAYGQTQYESKWDQLKKEFPTADKYRRQAEEIAASQSLPLRQALLLASDGAVISDRMKTEAEQVRSKELTPTGAPTMMTKPSRGRIALDRDSIARQLASDAKRLGIDSIFQRY